MCSSRNTFPEIKTLYIKPGSPWENGHIESFHDKLRDECLNRELFGPMELPLQYQISCRMRRQDSPELRLQSASTTRSETPSCKKKNT